MNTITAGKSKKYLIYQVFKYTIYAFLCYNMFVFFTDELAASAQTFRNGIALGDIILAFSASIDSLAWIVLLLVFELETSVISDDSLQGPLLWGLNILKALCYIFILYAAYGYMARLTVLLSNSPYIIDDVCTLIDTSYTYIVTLDEYVPITAEACTVMNDSPLFQITNTEIIGTEVALMEAQRLGWLDIINSTDWLFIVAILEVDVYLQLHDKFTGKAYKISQIIKPFLYFILFLAAIYWGFKGGFVDFWDAILWLLAFFFIEMNIFQWHEETEEAHAKELMEQAANE